MRSPNLHQKPLKNRKDRQNWRGVVSQLEGSLPPYVGVKISLSRDDDVYFLINWMLTRSAECVSINIIVLINLSA